MKYRTSLVWIKIITCFTLQKTKKKIISVAKHSYYYTWPEFWTHHHTRTKYVHASVIICIRVLYNIYYTFYIRVLSYISDSSANFRLYSIGWSIFFSWIIEYSDDLLSIQNSSSSLYCTHSSCQSNLSSCMSLFFFL